MAAAVNRLSALTFLDITPEGRNETSGLMDWVRHHDRYDDAQASHHSVDGGCH
jgi:predicted dithiol-disulfide oxidoreductase (DUF899 family)